MKKFIVIYHASASTMEKMQGKDPEEMKKGMEVWHQWAGKCGDKLIDLGSPLGNGQKVSSSGTSGSDKEVAGYSILQGESMEEAVKLLDGHPHLGWDEGCSIEIHESLPMPE
jgi:hypothetical protein